MKSNDETIHLIREKSVINQAKGDSDMGLKATFCQHWYKSSAVILLSSLQKKKRKEEKLFNRSFIYVGNILNQDISVEFIVSLKEISFFRGREKVDKVLSKVERVDKELIGNKTQTKRKLNLCSYKRATGGNADVLETASLVTAHGQTFILRQILHLTVRCY